MECTKPDWWKLMPTPHIHYIVDEQFAKPTVTRVEKQPNSQEGVRIGTTPARAHPTSKPDFIARPAPLEPAKTAKSKEANVKREKVYDITLGDLSVGKGRGDRAEVDSVVVPTAPPVQPAPPHTFETGTWVNLQIEEANVNAWNEEVHNAYVNKVKEEPSLAFFEGAGSIWPTWGKIDAKDLPTGEKTAYYAGRAAGEVLLAWVGGKVAGSAFGELPRITSRVKPFTFRLASRLGAREPIEKLPSLLGDINRFSKAHPLVTAAGRGIGKGLFLGGIGAVEGAKAVNVLESGGDVIDVIGEVGTDFAGMYAFEKGFGAGLFSTRKALMRKEFANRRSRIFIDEGIDFSPGKVPSTIKTKPSRAPTIYEPYRKAMFDKHSAIFGPGPVDAPNALGVAPRLKVFDVKVPTTEVFQVGGDVFPFTTIRHVRTGMVMDVVAPGYFDTMVFSKSPAGKISVRFRHGVPADLSKVADDIAPYSNFLDDVARGRGGLKPQKVGTKEVSWTDDVFKFADDTKTTKPPTKTSRPAKGNEQYLLLAPGQEGKESSLTLKTPKTTPKTLVKANVAKSLEARSRTIQRAREAKYSKAEAMRINEMKRELKRLEAKIRATSEQTSRGSGPLAGLSARWVSQTTASPSPLTPGRTTSGVKTETTLLPQTAHPHPNISVRPDGVQFELFTGNTKVNTGIKIEIPPSVRHSPPVQREQGAQDLKFDQSTDQDQDSNQTTDQTQGPSLDIGQNLDTSTAQRGRQQWEPRQKQEVRVKLELGEAFRTSMRAPTKAREVQKFKALPISPPAIELSLRPPSQRKKKKKKVRKAKKGFRAVLGEIDLLSAAELDAEGVGTIDISPGKFARLWDSGFALLSEPVELLKAGGGRRGKKRKVKRGVRKR